MPVIDPYDLGVLGDRLEGWIGWHPGDGVADFVEDGRLAGGFGAGGHRSRISSRTVGRSGRRSARTADASDSSIE